jgi:hypothetical protein
MYYEMKKKNVYAIEFNSAEFRYEEIKKLLIKEKLISRNPIKGQDFIHWSICERNNLNYYSSKDYQIELDSLCIFIGGTGYTFIEQYARDILFRLAYKLPFAVMYEVANDIQGKLKEPLKIDEARDFYKDSVKDYKISLEVKDWIEL